jgi:hypothetical protein
VRHAGQQVDVVLVGELVGEPVDVGALVAVASMTRTLHAACVDVDIG